MTMPQHRPCDAVLTRVLALIVAHPGIRGHELARLRYVAGNCHGLSYLAPYLRELRRRGLAEARPLWQGGGWWPV